MSEPDQPHPDPTRPDPVPPDPVRPDTVQPAPAQPDLEDAPTAAGPGVPPEAGGPEEQWRRLDVRYLVVGPFAAARQLAIPAIAAVIGVGSTGSPWALIALPAFVLLSLLFGMVPWLTTYFRITATQFEVRRGLLNKTRLTAPLDRVRSVDLEANLISRLLGLTKVAVGTGVDDTRIELDGISKHDGEELRRFLLTRGRAAPGTATTGAPVEGAGEQEGSGLDELAHRADAPGAGEQELARIDWSWLRFAPLSLARLAVLAGGLGVLSQFVDDLPFFEADNVRSVYTYLAGQALALVLVVGAVAALVLWVVVSVLAFTVQWWNLRLVRDGGNLRLTSGLLTTRSTSVEEARVRGVKLTEPLLMRPARGAELATLATGVGDGGTTTVLPPCPRAVAVRVGHDVLDVGEASPGPLLAPVHPHGPAARRRRHVRTQFGTLVLTAGAVAAVLFLPWEIPGWLPVAVLAVMAPASAVAAEGAYRNLGHALAEEHLVVVAPSVVRVREVLETDGVIGWVVRQSFFQRRAGLATLSATTAAGAEKVVAVDLPHAVAIGLADRATPGVLDEFLAAPISLATHRG